MSNRFLNVRKLRSSVAQEKRIAKDVGGRRVAGSGSMPGNKGDVKHADWLIEAKQTVKGRFPLTLQLWRKIETEAFRASKTPAMVIEMAGRSLVVISYDDWLAMRGD